MDFESETFVAEIAPTLRSGGNNTGGDRPLGADVDTCETLICVPILEAGARTGKSTDDPRADATEDFTPTLRAMHEDAGHANGGGQLAIAYNLRGREGGAQAEVTDVASLRSSSGGSSRTYVGVRRLTPKEAERLQGFEDDFTAITFRGKGAADGPRYRALGNSMAVPCVRWILTRLERALLEANGAKP